MMWIGKPPAEMQAVFRRATYQGNAGPESAPTMQCYDMIDNGLIDESTFDSVVKEIATQIRLSPEYKNGEVNKLQFTLVI